MINIRNYLLILAGIWGGLLNKKINHNLVHIVFVLTIWLSFIVISLNYLLIFLYAFVLLAFKTKDLFTFYIFFELSIIPIAIYIFLYGYQPEKVRACYYLLMYTIVSRVPLLLHIIYRHHSAFPITLAFIVKTPLYSMHIWLPKAHVESPVGGSIILAGVLLKLGSYGLIVILPIIKDKITLYISLSIVGSIVAPLICLRQGDIKLVIAYSSIGHIGACNIGLLSGSEAGYICAVMVMLGHGLCSPILFIYAHNLYQQTHSRLLINCLSAHWSLFPLLVFLNIGVPPSLGFWSEIIIAIRLLNFFLYSFILIIAIFFIRAVYNLYLLTCLHSNRVGHQGNILPYLQVISIRMLSMNVLDIFHI